VDLLPGAPDLASKQSKTAALWAHRSATSWRKFQNGERPAEQLSQWPQLRKRSPTRWPPLAAMAHAGRGLHSESCARSSSGDRRQRLGPPLRPGQFPRPIRGTSADWAASSRPSALHSATWPARPQPPRAGQTLRSAAPAVAVRPRLRQKANTPARHRERARSATGTRNRPSQRCSCLRAWATALPADPVTQHTLCVRAASNQADQAAHTFLFPVAAPTGPPRRNRVAQSGVGWQDSPTGIPRASRSRAGGLVKVRAGRGKTKWFWQQTPRRRGSYLGRPALTRSATRTTPTLPQAKPSATEKQNGSGDIPEEGRDGESQ